MTENEIGKIVVDCAISLHKGLGPGLLESVYEVVLTHELESKGLKVNRQVPYPLSIMEYNSVKDSMRTLLLKAK